MYKILLIFLLITASFELKSAVLKGKVSDSVTNEVLVGSTIYIKELKAGTLSGLDGSFRLTNISPGNYTVVVSYIGYVTAEIIIEIKSDNETSDLPVRLVSSDISIGEVRVIAVSDKATDKSARLSEKLSSNILNVVSAKTIELSPDLTIASVVQRISGVNLEKGNSGDGQYATLRGMDKRYNYTLINGIKIPSTNNKYRYLPLNLFPSDLVDRLEVTKALTPDMEADAIGGVVNMVMKDAPAGFQAKINFALGYDQIVIQDQFTGFNAANINKSSPFELNGSNYAATESDFLKDNLILKKKYPLPGITGGFSVGNRIFNKKLGVLFSGSLQNTYKGNRSLFFDISNTNDEYNLPLLSEKEERFYNNHELLVGLHNKLDFSLNSRHSFKLYNAYMVQTNDQVRETVSLLFNSFTPGNGSYTQQYETRIRHRVQKLYNSTLLGEHQLSPEINIRWSAAYSIASQQTPDNVSIALVSDFLDYVEQEISVVEKSSTRRWEHNTDNDISGSVDITYSPKLGNTKVDFRIGGMGRNKQRKSFYNRYRLIPVSNRPAPFQNFSQRGIDWNTFDEIHWQVLNPPDPTHALNYNASEDVLAGYSMIDFKTGRVQWTGGIRINNIKQGYILHYEQYGSDPIGEKIFTDLLPSFIVKYKPTEKQNIRASFYRGINLPGFLEIVPYIDKSEEYDEGGNPNLVRCLADNFDLRYEYFPKPLDQVMAGIFYKRLQNPIEYGFTEYAATKSIIYIPKNFGTARNFGFEVDFIKHFRNFAINSNYTWTSSDIITDKILPVRDINGNLEKTLVKQSRPLFGQSEHTANLSVIYRNIHFGWDAQVAAGYSSEKIAVISQSLDNDIWEEGGIKLDLSIEKKLGNSLNIFLKINNLTNTPRIQYVKSINPFYEDYPGQDYSEGRTIVRKDFEMQSYLLGMRYRFR